jgi:hypothetical protein
VLLDVKTHQVAKQQKICDIDDWLSPNNKSHDALMLEFRGTKPWTLVSTQLEHETQLWYWTVSFLTQAVTSLETNSLKERFFGAGLTGCQNTPSLCHATRVSA